MSTGYVHVIMPVGSDPLFADKRTAINVAIERASLEARFPDYLPHQPTFVLFKLIREIRGADLVIADLSHERPSCYYELGIAEAVGKKVHIIAEVGTPIHQSTARSLVRYYHDMADLTRTVERALNEPIQ
jgi:nucleoside 2-deoxyribosyltransferase